jgi:hypothetical protein
MTFRQVIQDIRAEPYRYLGARCPWEFSVLLSAYFRVDGGIEAIVEDVDRLVPGNREFTPAMRLYLAIPDPHRGLDRVLAAYEEALERHPEAVTPREPWATMPVVELLRHPIASGRAPMAIGEPTVLSLYSFVNGYLAGLDVVNPDLAATERADFAVFEQWLRDKYECETASWHSMLRIYEGVCERGVSAFLTHWDAWKQGRG